MVQRLTATAAVVAANNKCCPFKTSSDVLVISDILDVNLRRFESFLADLDDFRTLGIFLPCFLNRHVVFFWNEKNKFLVVWGQKY